MERKCEVVPLVLKNLYFPTFQLFSTASSIFPVKVSTESFHLVLNRSIDQMLLYLAAEELRLIENSKKCHYY